MINRNNRLLVGEGARKFADISGATMVNKADLITEKSKQVISTYEQR